MSEFSVSSTSSSKKTHHFSTLLLSDLFLFCSFIFSHPVYFLYFIFFSPYLLKLLSLLSPLFITTSLLLLTLLTFFHYSDFSDQSKVSTFMLGGACQALVERLRSKVGDGCEEFYEFEGVEAYKIMLDTSVQISQDDPKVSSFIGAEEEAEVQQSSIHDSSVLGLGDICSHKMLNCSSSTTTKLVEKSVVIISVQEKSDQLIGEDEEKRSVREVKPLSLETNKLADKKEEDTIKNGSNAISQKKMSRDLANKVNGGGNDDDGGDESYSPKTQDLGSFGSMRKEKEWRRTLACKLFEERHNAVAGGGDGREDMDLLWETHESSDCKKTQGKSKLSKNGKQGSNFDEYQDYEEDGRDNAQLCCLQALKFSAGKMRKPSLVNISKALKGIGWLHHVSRSGKKVHNH